MTIICLEGPDGTGKTSTAAAIADLLEREGFRHWKPRETIVMRCPGTTRLGELLRGPLKDQSFEMSEEVLTLAFAAVDIDAMQEAEEASRRGCYVVMDRCGLSNAAYRLAFDQERGAHLLGCLGQIAMRPRNAKVVMLDIDEAVAARRMLGRGRDASDRFEQEGMARWRRVREAYLSPAVSDHADVIVKVQENWSVQKVAQMVLLAVA